MNQHILIERVAPSIQCGAYPLKRVAGDTLTVQAQILRHGAARIRARVVWRGTGATPGSGTSPMSEMGRDRFAGEITLPETGTYHYFVEAWTDRFRTWLDHLQWKIGLGRAHAVDVHAGVALLEAARDRAEGDDRGELASAARALAEHASLPERALELARSQDLATLTDRWAPREDLVKSSPPLDLIVRRKQARFGAWYEMFPRSQGDSAEGSLSGTFRDAEARLHRLKDMGFDVVLLPPIHPIGKTRRKGASGTEPAEAGDPGSPWAVGSSFGGFTEIEPSLGTLADFDRFVATARHLEMEVALDLAFHCSPDHPWLELHPHWIAQRPDGTHPPVEAPPLTYDDIIPIDWDTPRREALWEELHRVVSFWIDHGVRIFRANAPHLKPLPFWKWLIERLRSEHADVLFLSDATERPEMREALGRMGFDMTATDFMWKNSGAELRAELHALTSPPLSDIMTPLIFPSSPAVLPVILQAGGVPAFKMRVALAATLSPSYGIYSGYELCEADGVPGRQEYRQPEAFAIKRRDWDRPGNIKEYVSRLNALRRQNPALQALDNLTFLETDERWLLAYARTTPDGDNTLIVIVNLDPFRARAGVCHVPPKILGIEPGETARVRDLLEGGHVRWGEMTHVRIDPQVDPARIYRVEKR